MGSPNAWNWYRYAALKPDIEERKRRVRFDHNCYEGDTVYVMRKSVPTQKSVNEDAIEKTKAKVVAVNEHHVTLRFKGMYNESYTWFDFEKMRTEDLRQYAY